MYEVCASSEKLNLCRESTDLHLMSIAFGMLVRAVWAVVRLITWSLHHILAQRLVLATRIGL